VHGTKAHREVEANFRALLTSPAQSVLRLATGWKVQGSNPGGGEIFRTRPDRTWGPPSLPYNGYGVSLPGVKRPGRGVDHPPPSSAEITERIELYLYSAMGLRGLSRANLPLLDGGERSASGPDRFTPVSTTE
jgi:hypothetical protein